MTYSKSGPGLHLKTAEALTSISPPSISRQSFTQASKVTKDSTSSTGVSWEIVDSGTSVREKKSLQTLNSTKVKNGLMAPETSMIIGLLIGRVHMMNTSHRSERMMAAPSPGYLKTSECNNNFRSESHSDLFTNLTLFVNFHKTKIFLLSQFHFYLTSKIKNLFLIIIISYL